MEILDHLTEEHRKVEQMMKRLGETDPGQERDRLVDELVESLTVQMKVEERFLYPIVSEVEGDETEKEAEVEHALAREGLQKLRKLAYEPGFGAAVDMLRAGVGHHVEDEEKEIFPALRKQAADRLSELDPEELERKVKDGSSSDLTKEELYEKAKRADIPGRSQMTKDELAEAVGKSN